MKTYRKMFLSLMVSASFFFIIILPGCSVNSKYSVKMQEKINALQSLLNNRPIENSRTELVNRKEKALCGNSSTTFAYSNEFIDQKIVFSGWSVMK
jgi:hypothetical protein